VTKLDSALPDSVSPLEALLELSRSASEDPLPRVLSTVAETIHRGAGFASVVLNIFRPAWDDYEAVLTIGPKGVEELTGTTISRTTLEPLLTTPQRLPGVFFLSAGSGLWDGIESSFIPNISPTDDPDAWQAEDGLLVFLSDSDGQPLALVSVDEPVSGQRPGNDDLRLLRAICSHAEHGLESARRAQRTEEDRRMLSLLLEVSPALSACATTAGLLSLAGETVVPALGFERFAAYTVAADGLELCTTRGWEREDRLELALDRDQIASLLSPEREHAGCFLLQARELFAAPHDRDAERSTRNGRGPAAWSDHCLVAPLRCEAGSMLGLIVIEDPLDRLLPSDERRRIVRLLLDQIGAARLSIEHRARLSHLASHDPLTGVRNRRGLDDVLSAHQDLALLVCDIDHFKQVNDRYGHDLGDRVLARFGELLRELARESDVPMRLGGEEFCIVMPNTDRNGAVHAAERLRSAVSHGLHCLVPGGLTVSIGVATTTRGMLGASALMAAADQGLYIAKDTGRDRTVCVTGT
jgi:diguanylate cyclase (GGDEF)-like protein